MYSGGNICPGFNLKACFRGFPRAQQKSGRVGLTRKPGKALGRGAIPGETVALVKPPPPQKEPPFSRVFGELPFENRNRLRLKRGTGITR